MNLTINTTTFYGLYHLSIIYPFIIFFNIFQKHVLAFNEKMSNQKNHHVIKHCCITLKYKLLCFRYKRCFQEGTLKGAGRVREISQRDNWEILNYSHLLELPLTYTLFTIMLKSKAHDRISISIVI